MSDGIKLYRGIEREGKTFIVDGEGRELAQVGPAEATTAMIGEAFRSAMVGHAETASLNIELAWKAMLSAATVDLTGAVVKVESDSDDDIASLR